MGGRVEFVPGEAVFRAQARRGRGGVEDRRVVALGVLVEGAGIEEALQCVLRDVGDVADGVQTVLTQQRGGLLAYTGKFPYGPGPQNAASASGESSITVRRPSDVTAQAMVASIGVPATPAELRTPK